SEVDDDIESNDSTGSDIEIAAGSDAVDADMQVAAVVAPDVGVDVTADAQDEDDRRASGSLDDADDDIDDIEIIEVRDEEVVASRSIEAEDGTDIEPIPASVVHNTEGLRGGEDDGADDAPSDVVDSSGNTPKWPHH
ncbi:MAG: hypothetical protein AAF449_15580, partial [Myxococcota bacterium]